MLSQIFTIEYVNPSVRLKLSSFNNTGHGLFSYLVVGGHILANVRADIDENGMFCFV